MDRVVELGDASVPYRFDVHTIAFVNNAPEIERRLHKHFDEFRVNKDNERKEFFEVADDVRQILESYEVVSDWYYATEAREYNESELMRQVKNQSANEIAFDSISGGDMTSYLILVSVVALLAGSIFLLMRGLNEVRVAKGALDEVKKLFDVTLPSRKN